uniref:Uncharacterized protein n=1 Tax=Siphoviridae sp. ctP0x5 TaxID=2827863 RepID=A0A8S5TF66_9CAUD|nr:MAG TPA: hypothetical protein [Siphoviridae sp. ctP0x5]DAN90694.1 MAG TPA: hypothetical protein [Bacteriophage sp.]
MKNFNTTFLKKVLRFFTYKSTLLSFPIKNMSIL